MNQSEENNIQLNQDQLMKLLLRAFMKGENITNINAKDLVEDIARNIKQL